jgi:hypothetical protein
MDTTAQLIFARAAKYSPVVDQQKRRGPGRRSLVTRPWPPKRRLYMIAQPNNRTIYAYVDINMCVSVHVSMYVLWVRTSIPRASISSQRARLLTASRYSRVGPGSLVRESVACVNSDSVQILPVIIAL